MRQRDGLDKRGVPMEKRLANPDLRRQLPAPDDAERGPARAVRLGLGFLPLRKPGKLPGETLGRDYDLEYGTDRIELHVGAIQSKLAQFMQLLPGMDEWHPMSATMAEECVVTFAHEFKRRGSVTSAGASGETKRSCTSFARSRTASSSGPRVCL